jgi:hypothetical protein
MPSPFVAIGTPAPIEPVTDDRLRAALITGIGDANDNLSTWATTQQDAGHATLADVPAQAIGGTSIKVHRYIRAVFSLAAATLIERYRSIDTSRQGNTTADILETPIDDLRRDAHWALNDIRGNPRSTIELI